MSDFKPTLCVDFDGVLHSYTSGWQGVAVVADPPVPGAIRWLESLLDDFDVAIYSSRSKDAEGVYAMQRWLLENFLPVYAFNLIDFPTQKPAAWLTIDDRAICFEGTFPTIEQMLAFKPWNKRDVSEPAPAESEKPVMRGLPDDLLDIHGLPLIGYHPEWVDADFNPAGICECSYAEIWSRTNWNPEQDCWDTIEGDAARPALYVEATALARHTPTPARLPDGESE